MRSYYILGYYTTNGAEDGKFRKITVKLNNKLAAKLEHREDTYADKVWGKLNAQDKEQQLKEALSAGDPPPICRWRCRSITSACRRRRTSCRSRSRFRGRWWRWRRRAARPPRNSISWARFRTRRRAVVGNVRDYHPGKLDPGRRRAQRPPARKSFQYDAGFTLEPGKYRMKFLVRENISGKMGTFETRFTVPDLSADTSGLKLSTVIWSSQREPLKAVVGAAEKILAEGSARQSADRGRSRKWCPTSRRCSAAARICT